jgi:putative transposase
MPNYRRVWVPGGTYFFTVNLLERDRSLLVDHVTALRTAFQFTRSVRPFDVVAIVVLPDHLHCIWRLPGDDADNAARWAQIKSSFSRSVPNGESLSTRRAARRERGVWQRRFWERHLRNESDLRAHIDYVHFNPVKHGLVERVRDWPYSSFHRHVHHGVLSENWGGERDGGSNGVA